MDSGNTAWVMISTALVMIMVPGVGLFYSGMVRKKNAIAMMALSFASMALVSVQWVAVGYSLSFGPDLGGVIGGLSLAGLRGLGSEISGLPSLLFVMFQMMFAAITLAIITSAVAERIKLSSFIVFALLWTTFIYDPVAHWVWGAGWSAWLGALDFAGGTVVHISSGFSALAIALVVGGRRGFGQYPMEPHSIPLTLVGAALLWMGWLGFNGGSALAASDLAANALMVTQVSAAAGALSWMCASWLGGKPSALGIVSGAIAGLVAITPAAGFVDPISAIPIGAISGLVCYLALAFRIRKGLDESLDAWAIHGMGGLWGAVATGIFATASVNNYTGLLYGNVWQFLAQIVVAGASVAFSFGGTFLLAKLVDRVMGLRVSEEEEYVGLDISQHGEKAYT